MRPGCISVLLITCLLAAHGARADQRPIVAVFGIQDNSKRLKRKLVKSLTVYLGNLLGKGGIYQIVAPGDIRRAMREQVKDAKRSECFEQKCQIEIGRELAANKTLSTTIDRIGNVCMVGTRLYDLERMATDITATAEGPCTPAGLMKAVKQAAAEIRAFGGGATEPDYDLPPPGDEDPEPSPPPSGDREYARALNKAWARLGRSVRRGTTEQKLEQYQKFLTDFPVDNPHSGKVQKSIDALEARLEKEETARREAGEKKAALEAKRARAREIQQAYDRTKQTSGGASEQLRAWESFATDYPDDNPYLKTARRKINSIEAQAEAEAREAAKQVPEGMVSVPAGEFWMGCNDKVDQKCEDDEKPGRKVHLDAFLIDKTEVTVEQYARCEQAGGCSRAHRDDGECYVYSGGEWKKGVLPDSFRGRKQPVVCVDWSQAKHYCKWAGKRLPTEAEWEKAARGMDGRKYPWGNQEASCLYAVMNDGGKGCGKDRTWPVCSKQRGNSSYGLCDMTGNVYEWVSDWYGKDYYSGGPRRNPSGPGSGNSRVVRGGSWYSVPSRGRAANRAGDTPDNRSGYIGFRCARPAVR